MADYTPSIQELIDAFARLPGVGPKSAQRIAYHLLNADATESHRLAQAITKAKELVRFCDRCFNLTEAQICEICANPSRDQHLICVVEEPRDVVGLERTRVFKGVYHVLGGAIDHLRNVGEQQLRLGELLNRVRTEETTEVLVATNPTLEGEATAMLISRRMGEMFPDLNVTRLAMGLPVGGDLEFADELTLGRAIEGRLRVQGQTPTL
jgi:recombination protein RecR